MRVRSSLPGFEHPHSFFCAHEIIFQCNYYRKISGQLIYPLALSIMLSRDNFISKMTSADVQKSNAAIEDKAPQTYTHFEYIPGVYAFCIIIKNDRVCMRLQEQLPIHYMDAIKYRNALCFLGGIFMKKWFLCLMLLLLGAFASTSCTNKNATDLRDTSEDISSHMSPSSAIGLISKDTLTVEYLGTQRQYKSTKIDADDSSLLEAVTAVFTDEYNRNNLIKAGATNFILQFDGNMPCDVEWDEFYLDSTGKHHYNLKNNLSKIPETKDSTINIPIGIDSSIVLNQSVSSNPMYRVIRILCRYDDEMLSYIICFDMPHIKG